MSFEPLAQSVEHRTFNPGVVGSSPTRLTSPISKAVPSSRGLGHSPFKAATRVRIPLGPPVQKGATETGFVVTIVFMNFARTIQKLENSIAQISSIANKHNCKIKRLDHTQEQGLVSVLFLGVNKLEINRGHER